MALLLMLKEAGYDVEALHCNFGLRGAESDRDELFVRRLCRTHDIPVSVKHFRTETYAAQHHVSIEMAARTPKEDKVLYKLFLYSSISLLYLITSFFLIIL